MHGAQLEKLDVKNKWPLNTLLSAVGYILKRAVIRNVASTESWCFLTFPDLMSLTVRVWDVADLIQKVRG